MFICALIKILKIEILNIEGLLHIVNMIVTEMMIQLYARATDGLSHLKVLNCYI